MENERVFYLVVEGRALGPGSLDNIKEKAKDYKGDTFIVRRIYDTNQYGAPLCYPWPTGEVDSE
jgi:hypothetical protein